MARGGRVDSVCGCTTYCDTHGSARDLLASLRAVTNAYALTLDHTCPPAPNACHRCTLMRSASAVIAKTEPSSAKPTKRTPA